jgi:uncharacterized SAM-binding protein YcdF (DUF218 family)
MVFLVLKIVHSCVRRFILALICSWFIGFLVFVSWVNRPASCDYAPAADLKHMAIIVLTGGDGRVETGLDLLWRESGERLFISGVNKDAKKSELLIGRNNPALENRIDLGYSAQSTHENAIEVEQWLDAHPDYKDLILVTSDYHMPRARLELTLNLSKANHRQIHIMPCTTIHGIKDSKTRWRLYSEEYHKLAYIYLREILAHL